MDPAVKRFGETSALRVWRKAERRAQETGLATLQVSRIERGVREVRLTTLLRLVEALQVSADKMLNDRP